MFDTPTARVLQVKQAANREQALRLEALEREKLAPQREQLQLQTQQQEVARLAREAMVREPLQAQQALERERLIIQIADPVKCFLHPRMSDLVHRLHILQLFNRKLSR